MEVKNAILFSLVFVTKVLCEPQCSPFSYHEQMLEKMVDVKYKMGVFMEKFERWEKLIAEKLTRLDKTLEREEQLKIGLLDKFETFENDFRTSVKMVENSVANKSENLDKIVKEQLRELDERHGQLETKIIDIIARQESDVNNTMSKLAKSVVKLENDLKEKKTPVVLFKARNVQDQSPSDGSTVVFQTIVQNRGDGYNSNTGIFTAPSNGTYLFTTQFCLYSGKALSIRIIVNDIISTVANYGDADWGGLCDSTNGVSEIVKGDKVRVEVSYAYSGTVIYNDNNSYRWSYFSGVLLYE